MYTNTYRSKAGKIIAIIMAIVMILTAYPMSGLMQDSTTYAADKSNMKVEYVGEGLTKGLEYGALGEDYANSDSKVISMTKQRSYKVTVPLDGVTTLAQANNIKDDAKWTIERKSGYQDGKLWEHQHLGGEFFGTNNKWTKFASDEPIFSVTTNEAIETAPGEFALQLEFKNDYLFTNMETSGGRASAGVTRSHSAMLLDYVGYYDLKCEDASGKELGKSKIRYTVYDSFHTMSEVYQEIDAVVDYVDKTYPTSGIDMYMSKDSLAESAGGNDVPYVTLTDTEESLDKYLALKKKMEDNPTAYREALETEAGPLYNEIKNNYKYPIVMTSIHSGEITTTDELLEFLWEMAKSHDQADPGKIEFDIMDSYKSEGITERNTQLREMKNTTLSSLFYDKDGTPWTDFLGYLSGPGNYIPGEMSFDGSFSSPIDLDKYYNMKKNEINVKEILDNFIFIVIPTEEPDGRTALQSTNANGWDQNRDHMHQTQPEATATANLVAKWNPIATLMFCVYHSEYLIEPCTPPHEPNIEYDLYAKKALQFGEAFGVASVSNNEQYNSFKIPMRDSLVTENGKTKWDNAWDDICTNYIPAVGILNGSIGITIEGSFGNDATMTQLPYGMYGISDFLIKSDYDYLDSQLAIYERGVNNEDDPDGTIRPYYVDNNDTAGAEAATYRPKYSENNNFFPEYYVIPVDSKNQKNLAAAYEMEEYFLNNSIKVDRLKKDQTLKDATGKTVEAKAGSIVLDMHQAKRNFVNAALYNNLEINNWGLWAESVIAFANQRGFDMFTITKEGAFDNQLTRVSEPEDAKTQFSGTKGDHVIIKNSGLESIKAVNHLLDKDVKVGFITEGDEKGHYVVSYEDYSNELNDFTLTTVGTASAPQAKIIKKPTLFVPGINTTYLSAAGVGEYGMKGYNGGRNSAYFDTFALRNQMGFDVIEDSTKADKADIFIGQGTLGSAQADMVKNNGIPYISIGAGLSGASGIEATFFPDAGLTYTPATGSYGVADALFEVEYPGDNLITASYKSYDSNKTLYGYSVKAIKTVPEGSNIILKAAADNPVKMGLFPTKDFPELNDFGGSIQAFEYIKDGLDITVFANTLTQKGHQQGDYGYAANTIFSKMLGEDYAEKTFDMSKATVSKIANQTYNGKAKTPNFTVSLNGTTLAKSTDYTVSYQKNKSIGNAKVVITGAGKYKGTKTVTFKINPPKMKLNAVKVGKKKAKVTWKKVAGISKYQIRYKQKGNKKWKVKNVSAKKAKLTVKKLKAGKKYQFQVRAVKKVGKENFVGTWSKTKTSKKVKG